MSGYEYRTANALLCPLSSGPTDDTARQQPTSLHTGILPSIAAIYAEMAWDRRMIGARQLSPNKICWYERNRKNGRA